MFQPKIRRPSFWNPQQNVKIHQTNNVTHITYRNYVTLRMFLRKYLLHPSTLVALAVASREGTRMSPPHICTRCLFTRLVSVRSIECLQLRTGTMSTHCPAQETAPSSDTEVPTGQLVHGCRLSAFGLVVITGPH